MTDSILAGKMGPYELALPSTGDSICSITGDQYLYRLPRNCATFWLSFRPQVG